MTPTRDGTNVVFPKDLTKLTPDVLTAALSDRAPGVRVERLDIVAAKRCGDGVASTARTRAVRVQPKVRSVSSVAAWCTSTASTLRPRTSASVGRSA